MDQQRAGLSSAPSDDRGDGGVSAPAGVSPHPDAIRAILALVQPGLARMEASLAALAESDDPVLGPMLSGVLPGSGKRLRPALALLIILMRDQQLADGRLRAAFESDDVDLQVRLVQESGAIGAAHAEAESLVARAKAALAALPRGIERDALDALATYVTHRGH